MEQFEAERQQCGALPVGKEAEVADAYESAWKQVQEEAAEELIDRQAYDSLLVSVRGVSPAEADVAVGEGGQPAVGDTHTMGVCAEIAQGMFRSAEGPLGVDHPVATEQESEPGGEAAWLGKWCKVAMELELAFTESSSQASDELAAEDASEHLDREEEGSP